MPRNAKWGHIVAIPAAGLIAACADLHSSGFQVVGSFDGSSNPDLGDSASASNPLPDTTTSGTSPADSATPARDEAAAGNDANAGDDGGGPGANDASGSASDTGTGDDGGSATGTPESGTQEAAAASCPAPSPNSDSLPFAVDGANKYVPSGYEGDSSAISMPIDPTCGGHRSGQGALGNCHPVTYAPSAAGATLGWAGVMWQHPSNNWGAAPGYAIPPGASKVSFWARGATGGEVVTFLVGGIGTSTTTCIDTVSYKLSGVHLSTAFTLYTISLHSSAYAGGVLGGFGFVLAAADQPTRDGGTTAFFIDDIEWQQ